MPTTSNFGWTTPADTDLVKDGAAAIRTLGNGIDTSLVDLKGGTTGQILSKNSNTDLDYTWINNDQGDITEVQAGTGISVASGTGPVPVVTNTVATTFDAKGDLVVGTGADTFAKLTVGTNGHTLVADSSTATGLKWEAVSAGFPATTSYTPTVTAQSGTITSYTAYGFYSQSGKIVIGTATINITTVGTAAGNMIVTLPIAAKTTSNQNWVGSAYERAATGKTGVCRIDANGGATTMLIRDYNFVTFFASGNTVDVTFIYEVA